MQDDLISRQAVLDLCDSKDLDYKVIHFKEDVECLPSVNPQPKVGHWIIVEELHSEWEGVKKYACDKCGEKVGIFKSNYCPNCGARMEESK